MISIPQEGNLATNNDVWAVVETDTNGKPKKLGLELASLAAQTASQYGGQGGAIVFGPREAAEAVGQYGPSTVYYCDDPAYKTDIVGPASAVIASLIAAAHPATGALAFHAAWARTGRVASAASSAWASRPT